MPKYNRLRSYGSDRVNHNSEVFMPDLGHSWPQNRHDFAERRRFPCFHSVDPL